MIFVSFATGSACFQSWYNIYLEMFMLSWEIKFYHAIDLPYIKCSVESFIRIHEASYLFCHLRLFEQSNQDIEQEDNGMSAEWDAGYLW